MPFEFYPTETLPKAFDILRCRYPYDETPDEPGPELHPIVVRQPLTDSLGRPWLRVIYGTSQDPQIEAPEYFTISEQLAPCRLGKPTRFCIDREARVPWSKEYFPAMPNEEMPRIGHPPDGIKRQFQEQIAYFQKG